MYSNSAYLNGQNLPAFLYKNNAVVILIISVWHFSSAKSFLPSQQSDIRLMQVITLKISIDIIVDFIFSPAPSPSRSSINKSISSFLRADFSL